MSIALYLNEELPPGEWHSFMGELPAIVARLPASNLIQSGRNNVYWLEYVGRKLALKHFANRGIWKKVAYRVRSSKARRSYEHSVALLRAGLNTPKPIAWREDRAGPWLQESFYVCEFVTIVAEGRALIAGSRDEASYHLRLMAQTIARMHAAGMLHLDLTLSNLIAVDDGGPGPQLYIIDNNRMRFRPVGIAEGIRSILRLEIGEDGIGPFLEAYARERGFDGGLCLRLHHKYQQRYKLKWRIKNASRPWRRKVGL